MQQLELESQIIGNEEAQCKNDWQWWNFFCCFCYSVVACGNEEKLQALS